MAFRNLALATAAIGLAAAPVMAETSAERTQPVAASSEVGDGFAGGNAIYYILGLAAVIAGVILIADGDDDDSLSA